VKGKKSHTEEGGITEFLNRLVRGKRLGEVTKTGTVTGRATRGREENCKGQLNTGPQEKGKAVVRTNQGDDKRGS